MLEFISPCQSFWVSCSYPLISTFRSIRHKRAYTRHITLHCKTVPCHINVICLASFHTSYHILHILHSGRLQNGATAVNAAFQAYVAHSSGALDSGSRGPSSSPGRVIVLCPWERHFTLTVLLSTQEYKWVPANCQGNLTKCWGVACDGLASHPGGVAIFLVASCYRNRDKLRQ